VLPEALDALARALRSGCTLLAALRAAADEAPPPLAHDLAAVVARADTGIALASALDEWAHRVDSSSVRLVVAAVAIADDGGGAAARTFDALAQSLRDRRAAALEARALSTQARWSAWVIAGAPISFVAVLSALDPTATRSAVAGGIGIATVSSGLALQALGLWWIRTLVARVR
jgi:tight adherence protein B